MRSIYRAVGASLVVGLLAGVLVTDARADRLKLKDGTVVEGSIISQGDRYWVRMPDGKTRTVPAAEVLEYERGSGAAKPPPPAPGAPGPAAPAAPKAPGGTAIAPPGTASPATPGVRPGASSSTPAAPGTVGATGATGSTTRPAGTPVGPAGRKPVVLTFAATKAKASVVESALAAVTLWQGFVDNNPTSPDLPAAKEELARWKTLADGGAEKIKGKWVGGPEREAILEKAVRLEKEANDLLKANQTLQAVKRLEEAATLYPNSFETNFTLGYLAMIQHNDAKALEWFNQSLRVRPDCPEAMANIGIIYVNQKKYQQGIDLIRKSLVNGDRKEVVQNLINAIASCPPLMQKGQAMKPALEEARLLASKYGLGGPTNSYWIIPLKPRDEVAKNDGKGRGEGDSDGDDNKKGATGMWSGTGFLVSEDGLILTNRHVVDGGKTLLVILADGTQRSGEVVVIDDVQDLALIRVKSDKKLSFVRLAKPDAPADGAECTIMGFPMIDRLGAAIKVTRGIISSGAAGGRRMEGPDVMFDARVNPGNSGGPVFDKHGNVMAVVSMKTIASAMEDTYGLGISAGRVRTFLLRNDVRLEPGADDPSGGLTTEQIATKGKTATVCILATR